MEDEIGGKDRELTERADRRFPLDRVDLTLVGVRGDVKGRFIEQESGVSGGETWLCSDDVSEGGGTSACCAAKMDEVEDLEGEFGKLDAGGCLGRKTGSNVVRKNLAVAFGEVGRTLTSVVYGEAWRDIHGLAVFRKRR